MGIEMCILYFLQKQTLLGLGETISSYVTIVHFLCEMIVVLLFWLVQHIVNIYAPRLVGHSLVVCVCFFMHSYFLLFNLMQPSLMVGGVVVAGVLVRYNDERRATLKGNSCC